MALIRFVAMPTREARAFQRGGPDACGNPPERGICEGEGFQCRHCLRHVRLGAPMLTFAYRPFPGSQPYTETGPVILCAQRYNCYQVRIERA